MEGTSFGTLVPALSALDFVTTTASVGITAVSGGFPRCATYTGTASLGTKCAGHERWTGVYGKLANQVKETCTAHSCGGHPWLLFSLSSRNTGCTYVLTLLLKFLCHLRLLQSEIVLHPNRKYKI